MLTGLQGADVVVTPLPDESGSAGAPEAAPLLHARAALGTRPGRAAGRKGATRVATECDLHSAQGDTWPGNGNARLESEGEVTGNWWCGWLEKWMDGGLVRWMDEKERERREEGREGTRNGGRADGRADEWKEEEPPGRRANESTDDYERSDRVINSGFRLQS